MIPLQDLNPRIKPPIVTWTLIVINVLVFLYEISLSTSEREIFFKTYGFIPALFFDNYFAVLIGKAPWEPYISILTHLFIHGGWLHLISNMWSLWIFGDNVEDRLGSLRFLIFYLLMGVAASLVHSLIYADSVIPLVGASGAISAVMGAYFMMYPFARILVLVPVFFVPLFIEVPAFIFLGLWFLLQFYSGLFTLAMPGSLGGVAWFAHLGGFIAGAIFYRFFCRKHCRYFKDQYGIFGSLFDLDKT
ncbi:MAG: rhomboid family intramembrane serine protease [Caldimicrobium sp.]|nr:rhomboid family intramembrane serine protease [Caldimicrobium sp.]MCX7874091.1 rhomboid family intramembrane serine protease [Caldimicrobium sp.]MDW8093774.1 rhomboid family intramembrane serine protease [Caldimicrobium sp.]